MGEEGDEGDCGYCLSLVGGEVLRNGRKHKTTNVLNVLL